MIDADERLDADRHLADAYRHQPEDPALIESATRRPHDARVVARGEIQPPHPFPRAVGAGEDSYSAFCRSAIARIEGYS